MMIMMTIVILFRAYNHNDTLSDTDGVQTSTGIRQLHAIPSDLLAAVAAAGDANSPEAALAPGIPPLLQALVVAGKIINCSQLQVPSWIRIMKNFSQTDCDHVSCFFNYNKNIKT